MNNNYITTYVDASGSISQRKWIKKILIIIYSGVKFMFDRLFSLLGIAISLPIMIFIAIAIKKDSKGPVLFKQERTGKHGKPFILYKFRTMVEDNDVHDFSKRDEHTKVGKFLRKTSLDELPQLFNGKVEDTLQDQEILYFLIGK